MENKIKLINSYKLIKIKIDQKHMLSRMIWGVMLHHSINPMCCQNDGDKKEISKWYQTENIKSRISFTSFRCLFLFLPINVIALKLPCHYYWVRFSSLLPLDSHVWFTLYDNGQISKSLHISHYKLF